MGSALLCQIDNIDKKMIYNMGTVLLLHRNELPSLGSAACRSALPLSTEGTKELKGRKNWS
jgi:hypothetical protein